MARQDALQGSLPLLLLTLLARRGPLHGYAMATQIEGMSDETLRVEEGSLYPALHRLEEAGWIKARWTTSGTGRRARVYEITADGRTQLDTEEARWKAITAAVGKILKHA
jgi:transcriptional regulator